MNTNLIKCIGKYANNPYYCSQADLYIWSVEELCYYLKDNLFILDKSIFDSGIIEWLSEECNLAILARELKKLPSWKTSMSTYVRVIFDYTHYLSKPEIKECVDIIDAQKTANVIEKAKLKADYFLGQGKYRKAIELYEVQLKEDVKCSKEEAAAILHNVGVAYARLFEFENASDFFMKAFELTNQRIHFYEYLSAKRIQMKEREYISFISTLSETMEFENINNLVMEYEGYYSKVISEYEGSANKNALDEILAYNSKYSEEYSAKVMNKIKEFQEEFKKNEG